MSVGYDNYLVGWTLNIPTEYGDPSSDDLSSNSEWDTDDSEPVPVFKAIIFSIHQSFNLVVEIYF